jgi:hypothetical protein
MRKFSWLTVLVLGLAWAGTAHAQSSSGSSSGSSAITNILKFPKNININVMPNITANQPMDYRNQSAPIGTTFYRPNTTGSAFPFSLSSMFFSSGRSNYISSTSTAGHSIFPTPAQMQAAAPSYFAPFQMYRASFIQP